MNASKRPLDAAVEAMLAEMRRQLREDVLPPTVTPDEIYDFFTGLENESDRAVAIVTHSFVDHSISQLMARELWNGIEGGVKSLFGPFAPLGSANGRLKVAAALSWIHPTVYKDLEILRTLRNRLAHSSRPGHFDDPETANLVDSLDPWEKAPLDATKGSIPRQANVTRRQKFIVRTACIAVHALCGLATGPRAIRRGLPPGTALGYGLDEAPPWYANYLETALRLIGEYFLVNPGENWMYTDYDV